VLPRLAIVLFVALAMADVGGSWVMAGALAAPAAQADEETPKADENDDSQPRIGREDEPEATEEPEEPGQADGLYESPNYGYQITYDAAVWQAQSEDDNPDDGYDQLFLANGVSLLGIFGDPDYTPETLDQCVADYVAGLEDNEANSDFAPLDEPDAEGSEAERSWTTINYVWESEDGEQFDYTRYFECIALGDGLTLVVIQDTPAEEYATEVEAREEVLRGFEMGGGQAASADETPERTEDEQRLEDAIEIIPVTDASHTEEPVEYEQTPPVGGPHSGTPQDCGFYDEPIGSEHAVHSLEHGAVWITYDPGLPAAEVAILEELAAGEPKLLVSPFEGLPAPVVASAWGVQLQLETADDPLLAAFIETFVEGDQAPEPNAACAGTSETAG
jgi:hypothetical protein